MAASSEGHMTTARLLLDHGNRSCVAFESYSVFATRHCVQIDAGLAWDGLFHLLSVVRGTVWARASEMRLE